MGGRDACRAISKTIGVQPQFGGSHAKSCLCAASNHNSFLAHAMGIFCQLSAFMEGSGQIHPMAMGGFWMRVAR